MTVARKELKEVSKNLIRFQVLKQGAFALSVFLFLELFLPFLPSPVPVWVLVLAVITWGLTAVLEAARWMIPSLRKQALAFRGRLTLWLTARRSAPWVYLAVMVGGMYSGLFFTLPFASWSAGGFNWVASHLTLFAWVATFSLVSLAFYNSVMRGRLAAWAKSHRDLRGPA